MKKLLAIDTSTELASFAVAVGNTVLSAHEKGVKQHALTLLPHIEQLLAEAELTLPQLDGIVFGRGPGSFTGLRVACSVAKGLAMACDLPLYPVSSLSSIAYATFTNQSLSKETAVLAMIDARMGELYWGQFTLDQVNTVEKVSPPEVIMTTANAVVLAGVGINLYQSEFSFELLSRAKAIVPCYPEAKDLLTMVQAGLVPAVDAAAALPIYIRDQVTQGAPRG